MPIHYAGRCTNQPGEMLKIKINFPCEYLTNSPAEIVSYLIKSSVQALLSRNIELWTFCLNKRAIDGLAISFAKHRI